MHGFVVDNEFEQQIRSGANKLTEDQTKLFDAVVPILLMGDIETVLEAAPDGLAFRRVEGVQSKQPNLILLAVSKEFDRQRKRE